MCYLLPRQPTPRGRPQYPLHMLAPSLTPNHLCRPGVPRRPQGLAHEPSLATSPRLSGCILVRVRQPRCFARAMEPMGEAVLSGCFGPRAAGLGKALCRMRSRALKQWQSTMTPAPPSARAPRFAPQALRESQILQAQVPAQQMALPRGWRNSLAGPLGVQRDLSVLWTAQQALNPILSVEETVDADTRTVGMLRMPVPMLGRWRSRVSTENKSMGKSGACCFPSLLADKPGKDLSALVVSFGGWRLCVPCTVSSADAQFSRTLHVKRFAATASC